LPEEINVRSVHADKMHIYLIHGDKSSDNSKPQGLYLTMCNAFEYYCSPDYSLGAVASQD